MPTIDDLVHLSHTVGAPALDGAILGEGNTSVLLDDKTFAVKGSGCCLMDLKDTDLVPLHLDKILDLVDQDLDLEQLQEGYSAAKVDPDQPKRPSVETVFHALLLALPGVQAVAHTHPTAVNSLTCATSWPDNLKGRLCPDEAVVLGPDSVFVPYIDPGLALARAIRDGVEAYRSEYDAVPKAIYMENHGLIAVGSSVTEAINVTTMAIKMARMRIGALTAGGIRCLPAETVAHLLGRSDEKYRQAQLAP